MVYQPLEQLLPKANNSVYRLVRIASQRAAEIAVTGQKLVHMPHIEKITTLALEEIKAGKVTDSLNAEQFEAKQAKKK